MDTKILKRIVTVAFVFLLTFAATTWAAEDLFLSDARPNWDTTDIYRVDIDEGAMRGNLTLLNTVPVAEGYALACSPDGGRCYLVGKYFADFGYLDLADNDWYSKPNIVDSNGNLVLEIVLAAFSPEGELFVASQLNECIYVVNTETGVATEVGIVEEANNRGVTVDLEGADMAFSSTGELIVWTNASQTMFSLTLPDTYPGVVVANYVFGRPGTFVTGMAMRANGYGGPIGSETDNNPNSFLTLDASYPMFRGGSPFAANWGDMANGWMNVCTFTIGYYKNHDWDGAVVNICGTTINEVDGKNILWSAKSKDFSMLFAQMIAAKLNVGDGGSIPEIDDAEAWLCAQPNAVDPNSGELYWDAGFDSKDQKAMANSYMTPLDDFNNSNHCD